MHRGLELPDQQHPGVRHRGNRLSPPAARRSGRSPSSSSTRFDACVRSYRKRLQWPSLGWERRWPSKSSCPACRTRWRRAPSSQWFVARAIAVERGQPLVEVETDKATVTYEASTLGPSWLCSAERAQRSRWARRSLWSARPGEELGEAARNRPARSAPRRCARAERQSDRRHHVRPPHRSRRPVAAAGPPRVKASPLARRIAAELGVDLATRPDRGRTGASSGPTSSAPRPRAAAGDWPRRAGESHGAKGGPTRAGADPGPADDRPPDGRVAGHGARLRARARGRHEPRGRRCASSCAAMPIRPPPTTTSSSRPPRWRCATFRASTAPTARAFETLRARQHRDRRGRR